MSLYRIWYSDGNDKSELGRVTAQDIDQAIEYAKKEYLKPSTQFYEIDYQEENQVYLMLDTCLECETRLKSLDGECWVPMCEISEWIEITEDNDVDPEYKTIRGTNEYANLNTDQRPDEHDPILAQAWRDSPQKGVAQLILKTAETIPAFSQELIDKSRHTVNDNAEAHLEE